MYQMFKIYLYRLEIGLYTFTNKFIRYQFINNIN